MIVRQYAPCSLGRSIICLGKQGEINALRVEFDVSAWMAIYPEAAVKLMHFAPDRPQDNPVIPTLGVEGTTRVWIVGEDDTASAGNGVIELLLIDERTGSTIKSATGYTTVLRSPSAGIEAQEAEAGYVRYDVDQSALLTDEQKAVARKNIGAGTGDDGTGSGGILKETDPTVPDWAKQPSKPTYTASEVGALPSSYTPPVASVNGKTGAVALSAKDVRARPDTWMPSASDVGADAAGTASGAVAAHNTSGAAHADLRALIEGLTSRLNALADSDDTTLDQLSEIVAYIKSNKTLIDAVTTGKVSVSDIVDNLTTNASGKVLSAAQGVALKAMIDGIVIPTALPNPQPITINGQRYDGSEAVEVNVAAEGGGATVELDTTLTQSGKAADAKVVGDKLTELNEAKVNQTGWTAGKYLGTDDSGNVVEKDAPSGGDGGVNVDAELREYYTTAKEAIRGAIEEKGVTVEDTDSLGDYANRVREIPSTVVPTETIPEVSTLTVADIYGSGSGQIRCNWTDVGAAGYLLVRKVDHAPQSTSDGDRVFNGTGTEYVDTNVVVGTLYYYRIFPYNAIGQYQAAEEDKSIKSALVRDRTGLKLLSDLDVGEKIMFGVYESANLTWTICDKQDVDQGYLTVCCDQPPIGNQAFDAPENASDNPNPINNRKNNGNNRWAFSNVRQWLNTDVVKSLWFTAQHDYDVRPGYYNRNGFMYDFTDYEKGIIVEKRNRCVLDDNDGGGMEEVLDKFWLASSYAVGLEILPTNGAFTQQEDDHIYELFNSKDARKFQNNWWLRTVQQTSTGVFNSASGVRNVSGSNGGLSNGNASSSYSPRPFCLLPTSAYMRWSDSDSAYIFADDSQRVVETAEV